MDKSIFRKLSNNLCFILVQKNVMCFIMVIEIYFYEMTAGGSDAKIKCILRKHEIDLLLYCEF